MRKKTHSPLLLFVLFLHILLSACGLKSIEVEPEDSRLFLNRKKVGKEELIRQAKTGDHLTIRREGYYDLFYLIPARVQRELVFELEPLSFSLELKHFPADVELLVDGHPGKRNSPIVLTYGRHLLEVRKEGFQTVKRALFVSSNTRLLVKLLQKDSRHEFLGQVDSGVWPKQVVFSPDGKNLFVPLLADTGFDIIDLGNYNSGNYEVKRFLFPQYGKFIGFTEGIFNQRGDRFFVSQMTTGTIYVISYPELRIEKAISTGGAWPKVIALSPDEKLIAVSNWVSEDISIIDARTFERKKLLQFEARTPRGLAFTPDNKYLYAVYFDSGHIIKISRRTWQAEHIFFTGGANRDIIIDAEGRYAYVSNMAYELVYVLDLQGDKIIKTIKVGHRPNTIRLTPDNSYLYVSCRGPNNPKNYELPSPEEGNIYVIDTASLKVVEIIPGGNQPTGLDISPDGKLLAFSNFQDNNVEVYAIKLDPYESFLYNPPGYVTKD